MNSAWSSLAWEVGVETGSWVAALLLIVGIFLSVSWVFRRKLLSKANGRVLKTGEGEREMKGLELVLASAPMVEMYGRLLILSLFYLYLHFWVAF